MRTPLRGRSIVIGLVLLVPLTLGFCVGGPLVTMWCFEALQDGNGCRTKSQLDRCFWMMASAEVTDDDIPKGYRDESVRCLAQPHRTIRYGRFGMDVHAIIDPQNDGVIVVIPSYE